MALIQNCGYEIMAHFILPEGDWWDDYYNPLEKRLQKLQQQKYAHNQEALNVIEEEFVEISLYRKYS